MTRSAGYKQTVKQTRSHGYSLILYEFCGRFHDFSEEGSGTDVSDEEVAIAQILSISSLAIKPYMFEPKTKRKTAKQGEGAESGAVANPEDGDGQDPGRDPPEDRVGNSDWCIYIPPPPIKSFHHRVLKILVDLVVSHTGIIRVA